jgi:two-component system sensor histidine kinase EvgS
MEVFEEVGQLFEPELLKKGLDFSIRYHPALPSSFLLDELRMRQIMVNLIGNAVKFTQKGSIRIEIDGVVTEPEERLHNLEIRVVDTGIGVSKHDQESIFESFNQASYGENRKYGGTGLGLTISRKLAQSMNGEIGMSSQLGSGSTFMLTLHQVPASDDQSRSDTDESTYDHVRFKPATVLVADDIDINIQLIASYLRGQPIQILGAEDGEVALETVKRHRPDVILMDIRMPRMNGVDATKHLRDSPETKDIPILAFTASLLNHEMDDHRALFDGYLLKPLRKAFLMQTLSELLPMEDVDAPKTISDTTSAAPARDPYLDEIKAVYSDRMIAMSEVLDLADIEILISELSLTAEHHPIPALTTFISQMKSATESFDFDTLTILMRSFRKL